MKESERLFEQRANSIKDGRVAILYPYPGAQHQGALIGIGADANDAMETLINEWVKKGYELKEFPLQMAHICRMRPDYKRQLMCVINLENDKEVATFAFGR